MNDQLKKFLLEDRSVRVSAVELDEVWQHARQRQDHAPAVQKLMGELMAAATLLASSLKFEGSLLLQLQGQGPIRLIVVECRADMTMRATVRMGEEPVGDKRGLRELINPDGQGRFSVILTPPKNSPHLQPYQGIVSADTDSVAEAIEQYMIQSEQLATHLWLHVTDTRVRGLMLQRMPGTGGTVHIDLDEAQETWDNALALCATITSEELDTTPMDTMLERLFWERPVISLETVPVVWECGCTRERVGGMLRSLGQTEVLDILEEQGQVEVVCEFCGETYRFDDKDVSGLFSPYQQDPNILH